MDQEQRFGFDYKDRYIPISDVGKAGDEITNEFNSLIDHLKLKYSFATISKLTDSEWEEYPINLRYLDKSISLRQFVKENIQLTEELVLLHSINGLEKHQIDVINNRICYHLLEEDVAICNEVFRLFQDVYYTFSLARFSLLEGYRKLHLCSTVDWKSGAFGQYWIRTAYLNNAIIWYNSCFDILIQTLWIARLYYIDKDNKNEREKEFVKKDIILNLNKVRARCKEKYINDLCVREFKNELSWFFVHNAANCLKHRNTLHYSELMDSHKVLFVLNEYHSTRAESVISLEVVIENLISYHNCFVSLVNEVKAIVSAEFKSRYNIEL